MQEKANLSFIIVILGLVIGLMVVEAQDGGPGTDPDPASHATSTEEVKTGVFKVVDEWLYGGRNTDPDPQPQATSTNPTTPGKSEDKPKDKPKDKLALVDDWQLDLSQPEEDGGFWNFSRNNSVSVQTMSAPGIGGGAPMMEMAKTSVSSADTIGLAVGGANDINNFRENINNGYLPLPTDITYEGLFYDYYFDTAPKQSCAELFCPSYSYAISPDPISGQTEYYMSVGLNSGIKQSDFKRKPQNLVVVLDISGSMNSAFNRYYYDGYGNRIDNEYVETKSKMKVAAESVVALIDQLEADDRFSMVLFDNSAYLAKPLRDIETTDVDALKGHILDLRPQGGTNMSAGMEEGIDQFTREFKNTPGYDNRIIFLTDAQPNLGDTSRGGLLGLAEDAADKEIYTSFVGIGVDFNTELIEHISKIEGANYYSVHNSNEFKSRMADEFDYMVTPLVFDLTLDVKADGFDIEQVIGSPEADEATGEIMAVNTLFPSSTVGGRTKGGIVLLKLRKTGSGSGEIEITASYRDRDGKYHNNSDTLSITKTSEHYDHADLRKAIVLSRYASLMKNWIIDERSYHAKPMPMPAYETREYYDIGIMPPPEPMLGQWERTSLPLVVSHPYADLMQKFEQYLKREQSAIGDPGLGQELSILGILRAYTPIPVPLMDY